MSLSERMSKIIGLMEGCIELRPEIRSGITEIAKGVMELSKEQAMQPILVWETEPHNCSWVSYGNNDYRDFVPRAKYEKMLQHAVQLNKELIRLKKKLGLL